MSATPSGVPNACQRLVSHITEAHDQDRWRCTMESHVLNLRGGANGGRSPHRKFFDWTMLTVGRALRLFGIRFSDSKGWSSSTAKTKKKKSTRNSEKAVAKVAAAKSTERTVATKRKLPAAKSAASGSSLFRIQRVCPYHWIQCTGLMSLLISIGTTELFGESTIKLRGVGG